MIYTTLLSTLFRRLYGEPAEGEPGQGSGLVLVADGVGGLDLCGTALKHVMASGGGRNVVRLHRWGHGLGRWHRDLTNVANRDAQAHAMATEALAWRAEHP